MFVLYSRRPRAKDQRFLNHMQTQRVQVCCNQRSALSNTSLETCRPSFDLRSFVLSTTTTEFPSLDLAHRDYPLCLLATALHISSIPALLRLIAPEPFWRWLGRRSYGILSLPLLSLFRSLTLPSLRLIFTLISGDSGLLSCFPVVHGWIDADLPVAKQI